MTLRGTPSKLKGKTLIKWDEEKAKQLWIDGNISVAEMADLLGVRSQWIGRFAREHGWPARKNDFRTAQWDVKRGAELFSEGKRLFEIADELGITHSSIQSYAMRHWPARPGIDNYKPMPMRENHSGRRLAHRAPEPEPPKPCVVVPRGRRPTLPPLPSLQEPIYQIQNR